MSTIPLKIDRMSVAEKLEALDQIWSSLKGDEKSVPSPRWHRYGLAERKKAVIAGGIKSFSVAEVKARLKRNLSES
jgi:hypothetical protein